MSDRTLSASFPAGPPSPSSPAAGSLKESRQLPVSSDHFPQTPASPPLMSVSDQNHVSNTTSSHTSPDQATIRPPSTSSPPSSTPMSAQFSQQPAMSTTNSFPTPASSVGGHPANVTSIEDAAHKSFASGMQDSTGTMEGPFGQQAAGHRRTDHDRQHSATGAEVGSREFAIEQGHAMDADAMDIDTEPAAFRDLGFDSLQKDFSSAYHLCKRPPGVTGPDPSYDLISLYGLSSIAQSVARLDPVTGEKINRLRKSYEGKLKGLGLAGRNKAVKYDEKEKKEEKDPRAPGSLRKLSAWPEEEWQNQKVFGKPIQVADIGSTLHNLQTRAMQFEPGTVPNNDFWEDVLGHEKPTKHQGPADGGKKMVSTPGGRSAMPVSAAPVQAQEPERTRPSRGRKRHYDDNSFVGYGEGYADDDDDPGFYSNGEGTGKKKRKKDHVSKVSTPLSERGGSYGVGVYGIGAR